MYDSTKLQNSTETWMMGDKFVLSTILGDPGADSGGEGKFKILASKV